ncbi:hypothetical protein RB195_011191 [Necator americanus]|uniref:Uncharacterized protein n=2 Tax=Necator americanus TaxID=51031 RepID=W2T2E4_NECAM|nr:hypothetical protein NECAME_03548 [Necator americanus]ETN76175.1 hypothetical protein NECAME_03548 [Necator americanus]
MVRHKALNASFGPDQERHARMLLVCGIWFANEGRLTGGVRIKAAEFAEEHDKLFIEAKKSGDHLAVTSHYYSVMSTVIDEYFGGNFHFAPPKKPNMSLNEALSDLHRTIGERLGLKDGRTCVDIGCGIGGVMRDLAVTGADITGITIAANEVEIGEL